MYGIKYDYVWLQLFGLSQVVDLDVTPGGLAVSCDSLGKMKVWTTDNGEVRVSGVSCVELLYNLS